MLTVNMIGEKITEARKRKNLSQAQLARQLCISSQAVGKWERGESMPDIITFNRLAEVLGVDLNYFSENFPSAAAGKANDESSAEISDRSPVESSAELSAESSSEPLSVDADMVSTGENNKKLGWDMSGGSWVDADFSGLTNLREKFSSSNMQRCLFIGSHLPGLLLKNNNVNGCDFSGSDISGSRFQGSNIVNSLFLSCSLNGTEFSGSQIKSCDFSGADFSGAAIKSSALLKSSLSLAVWNRTVFTDTQISGIIFDGTFEACSFENCAFSRVKFQNATLTNTFFKNNSSLKRVAFIDCKADKLTYAFLKNGKADMSGITLL